MIPKKICAITMQTSRHPLLTVRLAHILFECRWAWSLVSALMLYLVIGHYARLLSNYLPSNINHRTVNLRLSDLWSPVNLSCTNPSSVNTSSVNLSSDNRLSINTLPISLTNTIQSAKLGAIRQTCGMQFDHQWVKCYPQYLCAVDHCYRLRFDKLKVKQCTAL